jgi:diguanylate cyclase (GGDEF)-like protein
VMFLDLDDLKQVNDRLGHLAGNRALKRLAAVMREQCRSTDLVARYGGDEFAVVLIDSNQNMAEQVAGRIESALRAETEDPPITASIGIAVYPNDGRSAQDLVEAADRHLYRRKKSEEPRRASIAT